MDERIRNAPDKQLDERAFPSPPNRPLASDCHAARASVSALVRSQCGITSAIQPWHLRRPTPAPTHGQNAPAQKNRTQTPTQALQANPQSAHRTQATPQAPKAMVRPPKPPQAQPQHQRQPEPDPITPKQGRPQPQKPPNPHKTTPKTSISNALAPEKTG